VKRLLLMKIAAMLSVLASGFAGSESAAGAFINLDFEEGAFILIPDDPYGQVEWEPAMPGWTGYIGIAQVDRIAYNSGPIDSPGISILGPRPFADPDLHGDYQIRLHNAFPVPTDVPAIAQIGTIPPDARSIRFYSASPYVLLLRLSFNSHEIGLEHLESLGDRREVWGGDVSPYAGQTGELRFWGGGLLDYIQFLPAPMPPKLREPRLNSDGTFQFLLYGQVGEIYSVQFSENLVNWFTLTNVPGGTTPTPVVDPSATNAPARFYRTVSP